MKSVVILAAVVAAVSPFVSGQQTSTSSVAREVYQDHLSQNLRQLRHQVDAAARGVPLASQQRFAPVYDVLSEAESSLAALKSASALDLDDRRVACEAAIAKASRVWNDFKLTAPEKNVVKDEGIVAPDNRP